MWCWYLQSSSVPVAGPPQQRSLEGERALSPDMFLGKPGQVDFSSPKKTQLHQDMRVIARSFQNQLPSGKQTYAWRITIFNGKIHYKLVIFHRYVCLTEGVKSHELS